MLFGCFVYAKEHKIDKDIFMMEQLLRLQTHYNNDFQLTLSYFDSYLNNDIGKAKAMYLYLTRKMNKVNDNHDRIVMTFQSYIGDQMDEASKVFAKETDLYFSSKTTYSELEENLREYFIQIEQLKESAQFIDTSRPIMEIVEGRLDSDHNGTPDDQELGGNNISPIGNKHF